MSRLLLRDQGLSVIHRIRYHSGMADDFALHSVEYQHDGKTWVIEIPATSEADAIQRIERMRYGRYLGEVQMRVPVRFGFLAKLLCALQRILNPVRHPRSLES